MEGVRIISPLTVCHISYCSEYRFNNAINVPVRIVRVRVAVHNESNVPRPRVGVGDQHRRGNVVQRTPRQTWDKNMFSDEEKRSLSRCLLSYMQTYINQIRGENEIFIITTLT